MSSSPLFNPLTAAATELSALLNDHKITSVDLIQVYLHQIRLHNKQGLKLHCIISIVPESQLLETAKQLDLEREQGKTRSPYHGIPFIVKVSQYMYSNLHM